MMYQFLITSFFEVVYFLKLGPIFVASYPSERKSNHKNNQLAKILGQKSPFGGLCNCVPQSEVMLIVRVNMVKQNVQLFSSRSVLTRTMLFNTIMQFLSDFMSSYRAERVIFLTFNFSKKVLLLNLVKSRIFLDTLKTQKTPIYLVLQYAFIHF